MIKILYFGRLSERANLRKDKLDLPQGISSLYSLKTWLDTKHNLGGALQDPSIKAMVNQVLIHDDISLDGNEEIGFLPPVGGG